MRDDTREWAEKTVTDTQAELAEAAPEIQRGSLQGMAALERAKNKFAWVIDRLMCGRGPVFFADERAARDEPPTPYIDVR